MARVHHGFTHLRLPFVIAIERRWRPNRPRIRSTTQRRGNTSNACNWWRLTTSVA
jgi:electron transfer flavoprotein alpha/beta subunit